MVIVRMSIRIAFSMPGMTYTIPGPRDPTSRPRRKTTIRSYSRMTLRPLRTNTIRMSTAAPTPGISTSFSAGHRLRATDAQPEPLHRDDFDRLSPLDDLVAVRRPVLAAHEDRSRRREARLSD